MRLDARIRRRRSSLRPFVVRRLPSRRLHPLLPSPSDVERRVGGVDRRRRRRTLAGASIGMPPAVRLREPHGRIDGIDAPFGGFGNAVRLAAPPEFRVPRGTQLLRRVLSQRPQIGRRGRRGEHSAPGTERHLLGQDPRISPLRHRSVDRGGLSDARGRRIAPPPGTVQFHHGNGVLHGSIARPQSQSGGDRPPSIYETSPLPPRSQGLGHRSVSAHGPHRRYGRAGELRRQRYVRTGPKETPGGQGARGGRIEEYAE
mmetsp:Transcript_49181/g.148022  ORF Transcript_49181/g.148022 Transcript_49181/m.148022 type:complete len:258 (+) Transcript_49181:249-1022(+)